MSTEEKPRGVIPVDKRTQVERFVDALAHARKGGTLDVALIDEMLEYFDKHVQKTKRAPGETPTSEQQESAKRGFVEPHLTDKPADKHPK
jgi:hypothetical protein